MRANIPWVLACLLGGAVLLGTAGDAGAAGSDANGDAEPLPRYRLFVGAGVFRNQPDRPGYIAQSGPGIGAELGGDVYVTSVDAVGVLADTQLDSGPYGNDGGSITLKHLAVRYTHAFPQAFGPKLVPFLSAGVAYGRTGGQFQMSDPLASLMLDAGAEWRVFRHASLLLRVTERPARIFAWQPWWHNAVGALLDVAVIF